MKKTCPYCGAEYKGKECKLCGMRFYEEYDGGSDDSMTHESGSASHHDSSAYEKYSRSADSDKAVRAALSDINKKRAELIRKKKNRSSAAIVVVFLMIISSVAVIRNLTMNTMKREYRQRQWAEERDSIKEEMKQRGNDARKLQESMVDLKKETGVYPPGTYLVGKDMEAGEYLFVSSLGEEMFYQGTYSDSNCQDKITGDWRAKTYIAELTDGVYVDFSWSIAYDLSKHTVENDPYEHQGMFRVGHGLDLEPGTYNTVGLNEVAEHFDTGWEIYSELTPVDPILSSKGKTGEEFTVEEGDYLKLSGCRIEK